LSIEECREITERLEAKIVIPAHGDQSLNPGFAEALDSKIQYIDTGQLIVTRNELDSISSPEVIVMDRY
jgi:hypothetical protein